MKAAAHLAFTPFIFVLGWAILSLALPYPIQVAGWYAVLPAGFVYGRRNRQR